MIRVSIVLLSKLLNASLLLSCLLELSQLIILTALQLSDSLPELREFDVDLMEVGVILLDTTEVLLSLAFKVGSLVSDLL